MLLGIFRRLRILLMIAACAAMVSCIVLLLNFTAPNPTGRRTSSAMPFTTGQASNAQIGSSAENILARDLRLENNNAADQRQCFCSASYQSRGVPGDCNVCTVYLPQIDTYRRPDFINDQFVADSKNVLQLTHPDLQLMAFALGAEALRRPLWLYVRVNTLVDPLLESMINLTGGGVVYYFAVPGYIDPVDQAAQRGLFVSIFIFGGCLLSFRVQAMRPPSTKSRLPSAPDFPKSRVIIAADDSPQPRRSSSPLDRAQRRLRDAEDFAGRVRQRTEDNIDRYHR